MAGKENPFSRSIASKQTANPDPVAPVSAAAGVQTSLKSDELQQPISESDNGHAGDTPNAVNDNTTPGQEESFGLSSEIGTGRKGESLGSPADDANAAAATPPQSKADQFGLDVTAATSQGAGAGEGNAPADVTTSGGGTGSTGGSGFVDGSVKEQLAAASGDHGPGIDLTASDPLAAAVSAQSGGERLTDLGALSAASAIAGASATESEPSVADGFQTGALAGGLAGGTAMAVVGGAMDAGLVAGVAGLAAAPAAAIVGVGVLAVATGAVAGGAVGLADDLTDGAVTEVLSVTTPLGAAAALTGAVAGTIAAAQEDSEAKKKQEEENKKKEEEQKKKEEEAKKKEEEEKKRKEEEEAKKKEEEEAKKKAGGDVDPDDDRPAPPTPEEFALRQAIRAELGIVRIPGDIDPGDGDGTNTGTASEGNLSAADQILNSGATGLVGNPGTPGGTAPSGGGGTPSAGPDGEIILLEDGANVTESRTEDLPDFNVGSDPLVGFPTEDEAEEEQQETTRPVLSFDLRDSKDADDD